MNDLLKTKKAIGSYLKKVFPDKSGIAFYQFYFILAVSINIPIHSSLSMRMCC